MIELTRKAIFRYCDKLKYLEQINVIFPTCRIFCTWQKVNVVIQHANNHL